MVICPIARAVHCTGCVFFKFCPAKTTLGDYGKETVEEPTQNKKETKGPDMDETGAGAGPR